MKKVVLVFAMLALCAVMLPGCSFESEAEKEARVTKEVAASLSSTQPTPTDIDFSLERYNLIRRAYWVNGEYEKSRAVQCSVTKPLGYVVLLNYGNIVGQYTVDGKISSLNSYLTPDSEYYSSQYSTRWLPDVDGTYGSNDGGIFFFTVDGHYYEWSGDYLYSDVPFHLYSEPLVKGDTNE